MKRNRIIIAAVLLIAVSIAMYFTLSSGKGEKQKGYVLDKGTDIKAKDVRMFFSPGDFNVNEVPAYFKDTVVNPYTLRYFSYLDDKFRHSKNLEELFKNVHDYLYTVMQSHDKADELFAVYKTYTYYLQGLFAEAKSWGTPDTPEEALEYLHRIQDYRRKMFGKDTADALFGPSVKSEEYIVRREMIVGDAGKYGAEKEKMLDELKKNMWGDEGDAVDAYNQPLNRYNEKLKIYQKDLAEMRSDEERQAEIRRFREELFTPEQVRRIEEVDRVIADDKKKEAEYYAQESIIDNDPKLDSAEKAEQIGELQDEIFGNEADAFRRRLNIEKEGKLPGN